MTSSRPTAKRHPICIFAMLLAALLCQPEVWADGVDLFATHCASCHSLAENSERDVGPSLVNILDRPVAVIEGYEYSESLKEFGAAGNRWDHSTLLQFLESPQEFIVGTRMSFPGIESVLDRKALIEQLTNPEHSVRAEPDGSTEIDPEVERIAALPADVDYGNYLASECLTCHTGSGSAGGIPVIRGLPKLYLVQALLEYKNGIRVNSVMNLMAGNLGDEELSALSAFFTNQQP